jgi:hypothetical protein
LSVTKYPPLSPSATPALRVSFTSPCVTTVICDKDGVFHHAFISFKSLADICRKAGLPTFFLDGASMNKHPLFAGTLLSLVGRDSNGEMLELGFMVLAGGESIKQNGESGENYIRFAQHLQAAGMSDLLLGAVTTNFGKAGDKGVVFATGTRGCPPSSPSTRG